MQHRARLPRPPVVFVYNLLYLSLSITQPGKRPVKFNALSLVSLWLTWHGSRDFVYVWKHTSRSAPLISRDPRHVNQAGASGSVLSWRTCQSNDVWSEFIQVSDTKLSAVAFYRRFLGWVIKKIKRNKTDRGGRADCKVNCNPRHPLILWSLGLWEAWDLPIP